MTAPPATRPDFTLLDRHITDALAMLRLARVERARSRNADTVRAEESAESQLNGLLEYRHTARRR